MARGEDPTALKISSINARFEAPSFEGSSSLEEKLSFVFHELSLYVEQMGCSAFSLFSRGLCLLRNAVIFFVCVQSDIHALILR